MKFNIFKRKNKKKKENMSKFLKREKKAFDILMKIENGKTYDEYVREATKGMYLFEIKEFKRKLDKELLTVSRRIAHEMVR